MYALTNLTAVDHAVSASTVYLIRSLGSVWGVAITASIVQNTLSWRLPATLAGVPNREQVRLKAQLSKRKLIVTQIIDDIRHSVTALRNLPPDIQLKARLIYYDGIRYSFAASTVIAGIAIVASLFAYNSGLRNTH